MLRAFLEDEKYKFALLPAACTGISFKCTFKRLFVSNSDSELDFFTGMTKVLNGLANVD